VNQPTLDQRITKLEERQNALEQKQRHADNDFKHEATILRGVIGMQGIDIKEIKMDIQETNQRLDTIQEDIAQLKTSHATLDSKLDMILQLLQPSRE
jgi:DNA repair exonuclease SbcCD ATPase subunit